MTAATFSVLACATSVAAAQSTISGAFEPIRDVVGDFRVKPLEFTTAFTIAQPDGQNGVLSRFELRLPSNLLLNTRDFPACTAATINSPQSFNGCRIGSAIGRGSVVVDVPAAGASNVPGVLVVFNGGRTNTLAISISTPTPFPVTKAFPAKLARTPGRYGYTLSARVPPALQRIGEEGWPYQIKSARFAFDGLWRDRVFTQLKSCPKSGRTAIAGSFQFSGAATPTETAGVATCRRAK